MDFFFVETVLERRIGSESAKCDTMKKMSFVCVFYVECLVFVSSNFSFPST